MSEKTVTFTKDGMLAFPTKDSEESGSIRIPQTSTSLGAGFGDPIGTDDLEYASIREPIAGKLIYGITADIVEKWFQVNKTETEGEDPDFDINVQKALTKLHFKKTLRQLIEYERLYGKALLVASFDDAKDILQLKEEKKKGAEPKQLVAYPPKQYSIPSYDRDPSSPRFGQPQTYNINAFGGVTYTLHWSRCNEVQTRTNGKSVLELIWDDLTCGRNIRWGVAQWIFRTGGGFAVIKFPKEINGVATTREQLQAWGNSAEWSDITHRTYIGILNEVMDFKFEGAQGAALNPEPFFDTNTKQIAKATGFPKSILEGAEAGALTGSELNNQQYYKVISGLQTDYEEPIRWVIDACLEAGMVSGAKTVTDESPPAGSVIKRILRRVIEHNAQDAEPIDYAIECNSAFEMNAIYEARTDMMVEQANQTRLEYLTIDEVREMNDKEALPEGEGAKLKETAQQQNPFGSSPFSGFQPNQQQASDQTAEIQPNQTFVSTLKSFAQKVIKGEITKEQALEEGAGVIDVYSKFEEQQAEAWVRRSTQTTGPVTLSPEMQAELEDQKQRFLRNYAKMLEDAEKLKTRNTQ